MLRTRNTTAVKAIDAVRLRKVDDENPPVEIAAIRIRTADGLKTIWRKPGVLSAICESSPYGAVASSSAVGVQTSAAEVIVTGGFPPYSYAWTRTDSDPATWNAINAGAAVTAFIASAVPAGEFFTSTWECEVEDSRGNTATTETITATAENFGSGFIP